MTRFFIYEGDAYDVLDRLAPNSVDVCYASPVPAFFELEDGITDLNIIGTEQNSIQYIQHILSILDKVSRVLKKTGSLWLQIADYHYGKMGSVMMVPEQIALSLIGTGWALVSPCIWSRADCAVTIGGNERRFLKDWEYLYWFVRSEDYYFNEDCGVNKTSVFDYPYIEPPKDKFESGYPEELVDVAVKSTCPPNGVILDPFTGTGTTGVSALKNNRYFIGIEIRPIVARMIKERLANVVACKIKEKD